MYNLLATLMVIFIHIMRRRQMFFLMRFSANTYMSQKKKVVFIFLTKWRGYDYYCKSYFKPDQL